MAHEELAQTRRTLHAVAELVLAGPQYRATGKLRLRIVPGGFATVLGPELRAVGTGVVGAGGVAVPIDGHSARAIAAELGLTAGRPEGAYADGAGVDPDETLTLRPDQADLLMGAFARGHDALTAFAPAETRSCGPSTSTWRSGWTMRTSASHRATASSASPTRTSASTGSRPATRSGTPRSARPFR